MAEHYSKHLGVKHSDLVAKGVYNGYLDKDSQLHVDPLLLKGCKTIPENIAKTHYMHSQIQG